MSGLAGLLAGHFPAGVYRWHGAFAAADVQHAVEHAGHRFAHVDGWTAQTKAEFLAAVGEALGFPDHYGRNLDALEDCLRDVEVGEAGAVLLWDGWSTLARNDDRTFRVLLDIFRRRAGDGRKGPLSVLLRGEGPDVEGLTSLD